MKIGFLGLPLAALLLEHDGHDLVFVGLSRTDTVGLHRAQSHFGDRLLIKPDASASTLIDRAREAGAELLVSWFWTSLIPLPLVNAFPRGGIGSHPSLLPRHRGPDPYFWAIERGDAVTGVSVHRIAAEYDTGAVLEQRTIEINPSWNAWELARALDRPSLAALRSVVRRLASGEEIREVEQDESLATQAPQPDESLIALHFDAPTDAVLRRVRALAPAPGAYFQLGESDAVVIEAAKAERFPKALLPGEAAVVDGDVVVRTADGAISLIEVELDGEPIDQAELASVVRSLRG
ncbi:MAG: formyltransferase family protein [Polyangiaceae bacterium]